MTIGGWLAGAIAAACLAASEGNASVDNDPSSDFPPSLPAPGESPVTDLAPFRACEAALELLAAKTGGQLVDRHYAINPTWGYVLRARSRSAADPARGPIVLCWSKDGGSIAVAFDFQTPVPPR